jgi:hypothetical protein
MVTNRMDRRSDQPEVSRRLTVLVVVGRSQLVWVPMVSQARDLGVVRGMLGDSILKMNAFKS